MRNLLLALLGGVVLGEAFSIYQMRHANAKHKKHEKHEKKKEEKKIDAILADSFPASDAPSWSPGIAR